MDNYDDWRLDNGEVAATCNGCGCFIDYPDNGLCAECIEKESVRE